MTRPSPRRLRLSGRRPTPLRLALILVGLVLAGLLAGPTPGASAANYRYWGYWQLTNGSWTFAQKGPDQLVPADGSVEGWRYAVDDGSGTRTPRAKATFEQLCAATPAQAGKKRVGLVLDFGRAADAEGALTPPQPTATCVVAATTATGSEVLAVATEMRVDKGLVCALAGYPATGCGGAVATLTEAQQAPDTPVVLTGLAGSSGAATSGSAATTSATTSGSAATASAAATAAAGSAAGTSGGVPVLVWVLIALAFAAVAVVLGRRRRPSGV